MRSQGKKIKQAAPEGLEYELGRQQCFHTLPETILLPIDKYGHNTRT